jgi:hypothetical protein
MQFRNGFEQFVGRSLLEQVTGGAGGQRLKNPVVILQDGQHHDLEFGLPEFQLADALDARHAGQLNVHEHDIRLQSWQARQRFFGRAKGRDTGALLRMVDQQTESCSHLVIIFHQCDTD